MRENNTFEEIVGLGKMQGLLSYNDVNNAFLQEFISGEISGGKGRR